MKRPILHPDEGGRGPGVTVATQGQGAPRSLEADAAATLRAMQAGAEIVYQATFLDGTWSGRADFLERVDLPSTLGAWAYKVVDTKLARQVKPGAVLQLGLYALLVARLQGRVPNWLHLKLGDGTRASVEARTVLAYTRQRRAMLEASLMAPRETYPHPVAHCASCRWEPACDARRRTDDHPSLVAGMRREQVEKLAAVGVASLAAIACTDLTGRRIGIGAHTLARLQAQARLQLRQRESKQVEYALLPIGPGRGLALLPEPDPGDVFFDMEGDPLVREGGLEYLFGGIAAEGPKPVFRAFWAHDRGQEKRACEAGAVH